MKTHFLIAAAIAALASPAAAQDCSSVIALSRTRGEVVASHDQVEQHARNFCNAYRQYRSSGGSFSAKASYEFFSGGASSSHSSVDEVASRYCSADSSFASLATAYQQYIEDIAPGAFAAYEQCLRFRGDLQFNIDSASVLPGQFTMSAYYRPSNAHAAPAQVAFNASDTVTCLWEGQPGPEIRIEPGSAAILSCRRQDYRRPAFVALVRVDGNDRMTLPWQAFTDDGLPVAAVDAQVQALAGRLAAMRAELDNIDVQTGDFAIRAVGTRSLTDTSYCEATGNNTRGEGNGRVTFERPFGKPPRVAAGLTKLDIAGDSNRISFSLNQVDERGFNYSFVTWCHTAVYNARISWIAAAR